MKKIIWLAIFLFGFSSSSYATDTTKIQVRANTNDGSSTVLDSGIISKVFTSGARQQQTISIDGASFSAFTVPSGAKAVLIDVGTSTGLRLKGVTGDNGISLDSTCPVLLPISDDVATATLGIRNDGPTGKPVKVYWF